MDGKGCPRRPLPLFVIFTGQGAVAQLGEHLLCKQGVVGSIPSGSTNTVGVERSFAVAKICGGPASGLPPVLHDIVKRRFVRTPQQCGLSQGDAQSPAYDGLA
jgi:hypothetical protein